MLIVDLPGKPGKHDISRFADTPTAALRMIRAGSVATMAGDYGSINAYRDDNGVLRAERHVYLREAEAKTFRSLRTLQKWYRRALVKIGIS